MDKNTETKKGITGSVITESKETKKRGRKANTNINESPSDRFKRLANERIKRVMKDIDSIKKLSKGKQYEYTSDDGSKIENIIRTKVDTIADSFKKSEVSKEPETYL